MPEDNLHLPEHFDGTNVRQVAEELLKRRGKPLDLNASRVKSVGALGLQVLVSTSKQWQEDGASFNLTAASDALVQAAETLGIAPAHLGLSAHQVTT